MPAPDEALARAAYDTIADVYADHFTATEPEQSIELAMIDHFVGLLTEPRRVLDAGCGAGRMFSHLAARGCLMEGIDLSPQMIRRARQDHPEFPSRVGSLTGIDHPDGIFDGVFSWYSTIHSPDDDLGTIITEMVRITRPGGYLLLAFQSGHGMRRVGKGYRALGHAVVMNRYHRTLTEMSTRLEGHGIEVVARLERAASNGEADPQAVVIGRCPEV